jgi:ribonuclease HII
MALVKGSQSWLSAEMGSPLLPGALEEEGYGRGFKCVAGLDEVGRGPLAGPVVAAAVVLSRGVAHPRIVDSKLLVSKEREALSSWIQKNALSWGLGVVSHDEIDRLNILQASLLAMAQAVKRLAPAPDYLLIDGPHKIPLGYLRRVQDLQGVQTDLNESNGFKPFERMPSQRAIKKGDRLCLSIAAASIVAKVARDRMMTEFDKLYPEYGFGKHKGYSSPFHLAALGRHGPSPIHRASFKPVRDCLAQAGGAVPGSLWVKG